MKILIGADFVPTSSNNELFCKADTTALVGGDLESILKNADFRIFNLEVPLTDQQSPIDKCGPNLIAPTNTVNGYKALHVDLLTIANNHIMDQGEQGFFSTIDLLNKSDISYMGGGENLSAAQKPYIINVEGYKIGVYACAEHEFSIAEDQKCGANPFDPLESFDHVQELKKECDYVIVLYHGGKEHYRYPSPNLQKICRKFVEKGANLVTCQHTHCVGCEEKYQGGTIVYGQGNFLFDMQENEFWNTSLLIEIKDGFEIDYVPLVKQGNGVRLAEKKQKTEILDGFYKRSEQIQQDGFIETQYIEFAKKMIEGYLLNVSSIKYGFVFKVLNRLSGRRFLSWYIKRKYKKAKLLAIENYVECEAHRELLLKGLEVRRKWSKKISESKKECKIDE